MELEHELRIDFPLGYIRFDQEKLIGEFVSAHEGRNFTFSRVSPRSKKLVCSNGDMFKNIDHLRKVCSLRAW